MPFLPVPSRPGAGRPAAWRRAVVPRPGRSGLTAIFGLTVMLAGCGSVAGLRDAPLPAEGAADAYWALVLTDHAINLSLSAPTNTLRLTATAVTADGRPVPGVTAAPTYTVPDTAIVTVTPAGVLTAHQAVGDITVVATWQYAGVTRVDTAHVRVTETAPPAPLATLSIHPAPGDSAKWSLWAFPKWIPAVATDAAGHPLSGLLVAYVSSRPDIAEYRATDFGGAPTALLDPVKKPGRTVLTASTYAYGVRRVDSLPFTIGLPTIAYLSVTAAPDAQGVVMSPAAWTLGIGAEVLFQNQTEQAVDIVFDDSAAVAASQLLGGDGGNIRPLEAKGFALRRFPHAGTYRYRDAQGHLLGTLTVRAD